AMTYVSYRAVGLALPDLMAGRVQLTVVPLAGGLPLARDGTDRAASGPSAERGHGACGSLPGPPQEGAVAAPDLPTAIEAGFPELTVEAPLGFFGPKTMPMELRERIAADVR